MPSYKVITSWFTIEYTWARGKILFTVAILFLTAGLGMLTENIWIHLIDTAAEMFLKKQQNFYSELIGFFLVAIGFFILYAGLRGRKTDLYLNVYQKVQMTMNELYSTVYMRDRKFDEKKWLEQSDIIYELYLDGTKYIDSNKILIDEAIAKESRSILFKCAGELDHFKICIPRYNKFFNGTSDGQFNPSLELQESKESIDKIKSRYFELEKLLRKKMKWRLF